mmetsp:Transcript_22617/g.49633  ORF Transcript_22617/g.49633 Transcript_22617/m.49633 type:complete len:206 (-) Transcript_22617:286-903(-)
MKVTKNGVANISASSPFDATAAIHWKMASKAVKTKRVQPTMTRKSEEEKPAKPKMMLDWIKALIREIGIVTMKPAAICALSLYRRSDVSSFMQRRSSIRPGIKGRLWRLNITNKMKTNITVATPKGFMPMPWKSNPRTTPMPAGRPMPTAIASGFLNVIRTFRAIRALNCTRNGVAKGPGPICRQPLRLAEPGLEVSISALVAPF